MSTLLSAISGQFAKVVSLGTLFPVLIYSILNVVLVAPLLPWGPALQDYLRRVAVGEEKWAAVALTFVVIVITGILYNLNIPIIQLYEGYPWEKSWIGWPLKRRHQDRLNRAQTLRRTLQARVDELRAHNPDDAMISAVARQQTRLALMLNTELPDDAKHVLPTRLGNVIRCFERYTSTAYGIDSIVLWPRLIAKIEPGFAGAIDDAKSSFDFTLNCSFLSVLTGLFVVAVGLSRQSPVLSPASAPWLWRAAIFFVLSWTFYKVSIGRAKAWGDTVRAAFDLYRLDLLKGLGYKQQPASYYEERALWQQISAQLLYPDSRDFPLRYQDSGSRVVVAPEFRQIRVDRWLGAAGVNAAIPVEISVQNVDANTAERVALLETVPEGFKYVWGSATRDNLTALRPSSVNPLRFSLGQIGAGARVTVRYNMEPLPPPAPAAQPVPPAPAGP
ncbi:MAG TPA: hypothetical protein VKM93_06025 [Terriglobia bacterium]|nr:hypothetical protein [Terriglobia bacterium]